MNRGFPLTRLQPWFPGQMGVPGSDVTLGLRTVPQGKVIYVDHNHPDASDAHDGTDPDHPKLTIQGAVDSPWLEPGDMIVVGPATVASQPITAILAPNYEENVLVANDRPAFVTLMAVGTSRFQTVWNRDLTKANTLPLLDLRQAGWVISGFKFHPPAAGPAIQLRDTAAPPDSSLYTIIEGNLFDGAWTGLYGIEIRGLGDRLIIKDNWFLEFGPVGGGAAETAIKGVLPGAQDLPYECILEDNIFMENENHVVCPFLMSLIRGNTFFSGNLIPTTLMLDLRNGGSNIVTGNVFQGDYSNVGGYYGGAGDAWIGNLANDVAEAEVGDNGFTILPPT